MRLAVQAPTSTNTQNWHFLIVTDEAKRAALADLYLRSWIPYNGGRAPDDRALFADKSDPAYRAVLAAIEEGRAELLARPRMDMPGAVPVPQVRDFGRTF